MKGVHHAEDSAHLDHRERGDCFRSGGASGSDRAGGKTAVQSDSSCLKCHTDYEEKPVFGRQAL